MASVRAPLIAAGLTGFDTCRRLKALARTREIPVIFMTALTDRMLSGMRPHATTVAAQGGSLLEHLLYLSLLGDFASTYLGMLNGVEPSQVTLAEKFKKELTAQG